MDESLCGSQERTSLCINRVVTFSSAAHAVTPPARPSTRPPRRQLKSVQRCGQRNSRTHTQTNNDNFYSLSIFHPSPETLNALLSESESYLRTAERMFNAWEPMDGGGWAIFALPPTLTPFSPVTSSSLFFSQVFGKKTPKQKISNLKLKQLIFSYIIKFKKHWTYIYINKYFFVFE